MPLTYAPLGQERRIIRITGKDVVQKHLANLGFVVGELVTVISEIDGNMILRVKDTRVALDRSMVCRIIV